MRVRIVDAFTDSAFGGNPAGVVILEGGKWPQTALLHDIADELDLPMTAFALPREGDPEAEWQLRWFRSPRAEEPICGHATLAVGHALLEDRGAPGRDRFLTQSGVLATESAADGTITLDFPAAPVHACPAPEGLADALGAAPEATFAAPRVHDVLAVFADERAVRALAPDMAALGALREREGLRAVTATGPADAGSGFDIVSRFFSPGNGLPEDPVTGSAHTALAPYWCERLGRNPLRAFQASARGGVLGVELAGERVLISGRAVTVLDGTLRAGR